MPALRVKLLTLPFRPALGAIDSQALDGFLADKELVALHDHFFVAQGLPHLLCVVAYRLPRGAAATTSDRRTGREPLELDDAQRALFETLRVWRSERSRRDGVPPYVLFHDRELASIARERPCSENALLQIAGVGAGKVERYGKDLLAILAPERDGRELAT
jgi:superfamily II DNA helicase RecQ